MEKQIMEYASGNEMAAIAIKQIGYDLMGYYPITPSTQIAENLDKMRADGKTDIVMIPAEGEHSAAGICYGAAVAGGRVVNATSANGLLYAMEQFPVQSGTRYPMVMNVPIYTSVYEQETLMEFRLRADCFLSEIIKENSNNDIVAVITHGGMINQLYASFLRLPVDNNISFVTGDTGIHCWYIDDKSRRIIAANQKII